MTDWKPAGNNSLSPYLLCRDSEAEIDFVKRVFGAQPARRFDGPDGTLMHAELRLDDSILMLGQSPQDAGGAPHLHLYVPDVMAVWERAMQAGGKPVQEPVRKDDSDDLRGGFTDPEGVTWWIATQ